MTISMSQWPFYKALQKTRPLQRTRRSHFTLELRYQQLGSGLTAVSHQLEVTLGLPI